MRVPDTTGYTRQIEELPDGRWAWSVYDPSGKLVRSACEHSYADAVVSTATAACFNARKRGRLKELPDPPPDHSPLAISILVFLSACAVYALFSL